MPVRLNRPPAHSIEAFSEKEAAEKVCGVALTAAGKLAQLRARVLTLGDRRQTRATPFYTVDAARCSTAISAAPGGSIFTVVAPAVNETSR